MLGTVAHLTLCSKGVHCWNLTDLTRYGNAVAIHHALSGELIALTRLPAPTGDDHSTTLVRDDNLKVLRLVLASGKELPAHAVEGPIMLHCLDGVVQVIVGGSHTTMHAGELMYVAGGVTHSLRAMADSSMLLSIVIKNLPD
jgi:quercetin dioxygenase-like cupin family protein